MGYQELIAGLQREAEATIHSIWMEANKEIQRLKDEASNRIKMMRERYEDKRIHLTNSLRKRIMDEARQMAREIRLKAEDEISKRLFRIASDCLRILRNDEYGTTLSMLIKELPSDGWDKVMVNPEDVEMVKGYFPDAEIIPDRGITGGFIVIKNDKMSIINTFDKRLERAWDELLPLIIRDIKMGK